MISSLRLTPNTAHWHNNEFLLWFLRELPARITQKALGRIVGLYQLLINGIAILYVVLFDCRSFFSILSPSPGEKSTDGHWWLTPLIPSSLQG
jgi:hypothetical protein